MGRHKQEISITRRNDSPYYHYKTEYMQRYRTTGKKSQKAAYQFALEQLIKERDGSSPDITLDVFCKNFFKPEKKGSWAYRLLKKERVRISTVKWRAGLYKNHIKKYIGHLRLRDLNPSRIDHWLDGLSIASQSKRHCLTTLSVILKEAMRDNIIEKNPCKLVEMEKIRNKRNEPPTWEELNTLFPEDLNDFKKIWGNKIHYGVMCQLITATGLRLSEARALTPKAFDFQRNGLYVVRAVNASEELDLPKAEEVRVILLDSRTTEFMQWWLNWGSFEESDLIFPGRTGNPIHRGTILKSYKEALMKAKISIENRKLTVHGLRHAYNTRMRELLHKAAMEGFWDDVSMTFGGSLKNADKILREFTGHKSNDMTNLYDHPDLKKKLEAYKIFQEIIESFWVA